MWLFYSGLALLVVVSVATSVQGSLLTDGLSTTEDPENDIDALLDEAAETDWCNLGDAGNIQNNLEEAGGPENIDTMEKTLSIPRYAKEGELLENFISVEDSEMDTLISEIMEYQHSKLNFTLKVLQKLAGSNTESNSFFSPASLIDILGLIHLGAEGDTAAELATALELPNDPEVMCSLSQSVIFQLQEAINVTFTIRNKIYADSSHTLRPDYASSAQTCFEAEVENIDFEETKEAAEKINSWVASSTNDRITNLVDSSQLQGDTSLLLVNAIYFYGQWAEKFDKENTKHSIFRRGTESMGVQMMVKGGFHASAQLDELEAIVLLLPYLDKNVKMMLILPDENSGGISNVAEKLKGYTFDQITSLLQYQFSTVLLPEFKIEDVIKMGEILHKLGINRAFGDNANLNHMAENEGLRVTDIFQKSYILVDENGSESAAGTGSILVPISAEEEIEFNRPFFFIIWKLMERNEGQNVFFSPVSLFSVLGMIHTGAAGKSAEQIANALDYPLEEPECICNASRLLIQSVKSIENVTMQMANKIYTEKKIRLRQEYLDDVDRCFESEIEPIDFTDKERAAEDINQWVRNVTNKKIDNLVSADKLPEKTLMVLLNGIYFKGSWGVPFKKEKTSLTRFYCRKNVTQVHMMEDKGYFLYSEHAELESQVIALPYKDENIFMLIILPNDRFAGLEGTAKKLKDYSLSQLSNDLYYEEVHLKLPRFNIESDLELNHVLDELGITHLFTSLVNLSKMSDEKLQVSKVFQKGIIEVNEEGSEASAATGAITVPLTIGQQYEMTVDHPFIFGIWDKRYDSFLFAGTFQKPPQL